MAVTALLANAAQAQVAPTGTYIDLDTNTPVTTGVYTQYRATVTAPTAGQYYVLYAFREDPSYFGFDDVSFSAVGTPTNLLTNPGFEDGSTPSPTDSNLQLPNGWGTVYQTGQIPPAAGTVSGSDVHSGSSSWYDGSVGSFDGLFQVVTAAAGQQFNSSFWLDTPNAFETGSANGGGIEVAAYFGLCNTTGGGCITNLGSGFTVQVPSQPAVVIDTLDGDLAPGLFSLGSPAAQAGQVEFQGGTLQLTGGALPGNIVTAPVLLDAAGGTVDTSTGNGGFSGTVAGPGSLTIQGGGTFSLTAANSYAGGTIVNASMVAVASSTALGTGTLTLNGGTLQAAAGGLTIANAATLSGTGTVDTQAFGLTYAGAIAGSGQLAKAGTGTLTLTGANTYAGGTALNAGTIALGNGMALGTGAVTFNGGTLQAAAGGLTANNAIILASNGTIDTQGFGLTATGAISGAGQLAKIGSGTLTLAGANTYSGGTALTAGTIALGNGGALGTGTVTFGGGTLRAATGGLTANNAIVLASNGTIDTQAFGLTATGAISGAGQLAKIGGGTLTLAGANSYSGGTALTAGTIALGNGGALGTGTVTFGGGTLQAAADGLTTNNAIVLASNGTIDTQAFGLTATGAISGAGQLAKIGGGTLTLAGANSYSGGTALTAGTITLGNGGALGTGTVTFGGGTLQASANGLTANNAIILASNGTIDTQAFGLTATGAISGAGQLTKIGGGTLTLAGANTYSGGTALTAGTIALGNGGALGTGTVTFGGGTLQAAADGLTANNAIVLTSNGTIDTQGFGLTSAGIIGGAGGLTKLGSGTLALTAANTYAGGTQLTAGTLAVGDNAALGTGSLTIGGGTLQAGRDGLTLANAATLAGAATIDTQGFGLTYAGAIGGSGSLTKLGGGTLTLTSADSFAGGTQLNAGTLALGNATALGSGTLTFAGGTLRAATDGLSIGNAATLASAATIDTQGFGLTYAGAIAGPGGLTKTGSGTLILAAGNSFAGGTHLAAGTLVLDDSAALGTGALQMDEGTTLAFGVGGLTVGNAIAFTGTADPTIDTGAGNQTIAGVISGPGALTKEGTGALVLTANNPYTGPTTVATGTLVVDGSDPFSAVTVNAGAVLGGTGTVGAVTAAAGATIAPGVASPYGALNVSGALTFAPGSTFAVNVSPAGQSDALRIAGIATLNGAAVTLINPVGTSLARSYSILSAAGGVSGTFGSVTTLNPLAFLSPAFSYGATSVTATLQPNGNSFASQAVTPNQASVARSLQGLGPSSPLYSAILALTPAQAQQAFDAVSGSIHASATTASIQDARQVSSQIFTRLWNIGGGELDARNLLDKLAPTDLPSFVRCFAPGTAPPAAPTVTTTWGEAFGDFGHDKGDANGAGLDRSLGGFVLGIDAPIHGLGAPYRIGIAGGYTKDMFGGSGRSTGAGTFESVFGALYGGTRYGAVDIRVAASVAGNMTHNQRVVAFPGFAESETSSYGGSTVQGFAEIGYRFASPLTVVEPVVDAAITHVHQDGYREAGGAAALIGAPQGTDVGTTTLGVRGETAPISGLPLVARAFVGWQHAFGDVSPKAQLAFEAGSIPFTSAGAPAQTDALAAEAGLDWRYSDRLAFALSYLGQIGSRDEDNGVKGRVEYKF